MPTWQSMSSEQLSCRNLRYHRFCKRAYEWPCVKSHQLIVLKHTMPACHQMQQQVTAKGHATHPQRKRHLSTRPDMYMPWLPCKQHHLRTRMTAAALGRRELLGASLLSSGCCSSLNCAHRSQWYDKYFAYNMAVGMTEYEAAIRPVKQVLFKQLFMSMHGQLAATGNSSSSSSSSNSSRPVEVLEVGIGTGPNLPFYTSFSSTSSSRENTAALNLSITGLDPNSSMFDYAERAAFVAGLNPQQLHLVEGDAQQMAFGDATFDAAVLTLVLCSVPQPAAVLSELLRVLKPGRQLLLIEHVIAPQPSLLQLQQRLMDPVQQILADNCHLTRDTAAVVRATSFIPQLLPPLPLRRGKAAVAGGGFGVGRDYAVGDGGTAGNGGGLPGVVDGSVDLWRFELPGVGLIAPHVAGILKKPI